MYFGKIPSQVVHCYLRNGHYSLKDLREKAFHAEHMAADILARHNVGSRIALGLLHAGAYERKQQGR